ncbi:MAG: hypothetical protein E2P02_08150 [Acidobacteria bacterium]|nr:MAG: hypothetical protein E2P02_08150 [Acidobacteriota bacterium]
MPAPIPLTYERIFRLWGPLAATWLMMAAEGPFLAAVIARLDEPTFNLAAYGVAFALALVVEAPIIMILSAATALVEDWDSFRKLRNFTYVLNLLITLLMFVVIWPPVFDWLAVDVLVLPTEVRVLTHQSLVLLLPWPAAIGYRRFYQGLLIRQEMTRRVAYGTAVRVVTMATTAVVLYVQFRLPGALVGAASLSSGVVVESVATRLMALGIPDRIRALEPSQDVLTYRRIADFYWPLALTSVISLAVHPMVTFSLGQSRLALESLAVYPVVTALTFIFRSVALSYQEVAITLLDGTRENYRLIARFAFVLGVLATVGLVVIAFTPLAGVWFQTVSGLSKELVELSVRPLQLFCLIPFFSVLLAFQRSILVFGRYTRPVTVATVIEVTAIVGLLFLTIRVLDMVGVVGAVLALFGGRLVGNTSMMFPVYRVLVANGIYRR